VKECALNLRVLIFFISTQPLFNMKNSHNYFHEFLNPVGNYYTRRSSICYYWNAGALPFMVTILGFAQPIMM
jgi:hypothetical protein